MTDSTPDHLTFVVFGATGDLARRKLAPALFHLHSTGALPGLCRMVGVARSDLDDGAFRTHLRAALEEPAKARPGAWEEFASRIAYRRGSADDVADLRALNHAICTHCGGHAQDNRLYHLALAPDMYPGALRAMGEAGLLDQSDGWRRVVIEKPFGTDLESARNLNEVAHSVLDESQVFRIDHYLGKDTVQNLFVLRFANSILEPLWNRNYIDHVQVSVLESVGVEERAAYYDRAGVLRDMFQNHILQLLTLVAMEPPASLHPNALRGEKAKVLTSVRPIAPDDVATHSVRARYRGYLDEPEVAPDSPTATFAALRLHIDNWRWQGVPFVLRSGKRLHDKDTAIAVRFRRPPHALFDVPDGERLDPNTLLFSIQPHEGVHLSLLNKAPGPGMATQPEELEFHFPPQAIRDSYERLLLDAVNDDASLFTRADEIELAWSIIDPFIVGWQSKNAPPLLEYEPGSTGPEEAAALLGPDRRWLTCHP